MNQAEDAKARTNPFLHVYCRLYVS